MWNLKNEHTQKTKNKLTDTEAARGRGWEIGEISEVGQKVQTSSYKINKSWGSNVQHGDCG